MIENLIIGIVGSIIATGIIYLLVKWYRKKVKAKKELEASQTEQISIGKTLLDQGLTRFHFSRDDYQSTLATLIQSASQNISIVSISLKNTNDEGKLTDIFRKKLSFNPTFKIEVSLINPFNNELVKIAANTLNISEESLKYEITEMLRELINCFDYLDSSEKSRFKILVHDCFPMGSVLMIDTTPTGGLIQIETKLYKSPRTNSFGFQLTKSSPFFKHNYEAWNRVIADSIPFNERILSKSKIKNF